MASTLLEPAVPLAACRQRDVDVRARDGAAAEERVQEQQLAAFLADVERRALRMAEFAVRDRDEALDLVQEAMFKLVRRYRRAGPDQWPALFHRILQNQIRDFHRRNSRWGRLLVIPRRTGADDQALPEPEAIDPVAPIHERLDQADAMQALDRAIAQLPRQQQQAFLLRVWEGLSVREAARAMQCSEGSVKTHLFRAMRALRARLEAHRP